jgi:hypothetical protein
MARLFFNFRPIMNGNFPYGGFGDDPLGRGKRPDIKQPQSTKPRPPKPKRSRI